VIEAQAGACARRAGGGQQWHVNVERGRLVYQDERGLMDLAAPRLFGRHQFDNAGLAIATLRAQEVLRIEPAAFEAGILGANGRRECSALRPARWWSGRRRAARYGSTADTMPTAGASSRRPWRPRRAGIAAVGGHRRHDGQQGCRRVLANFAGLTRHIIAVPIPDRDDAMPPDRLADAGRQLGMRVEIAGTVEAALAALRGCL